ncbi:MAG: cell division protein FtsQ/DivIB [Mariprofundaceae bacterium]|nr:cell division protein FtsQ/DivIB [Mariprofundaceae bacterium]
MLRKNRRNRPPRDWRKLGRRILGLGMAVLVSVSAGLLAYLGNELFSIHRITIVHTDESLKKAIRHKLGNTLDFIHSRPAYIRHVLLDAFPDLCEVRVERRLPHTLVISPQVRRPVALWAGRNGIYLVDARGQAYRKLRHGEDHDLPLLRMPEKSLPEATQLLTALAARNQTLLGRLSECIGEKASWKLYFDSGQRWLLPRGAKTGAVISRVYSLMSKSPWRNGKWQIDARYPERWFIRQAQHGGVI